MFRNFVDEIIAAPYSDTYIPSHQYGPDYIKPASEHRTWLPHGAVNIKYSDSELQPKSIITFFRETVEENPETVALVTKRDGEYMKWTYGQYLCDVRDAAKGFIKLGLNPYHGVCILGFNSPEWLISHLAAVFAGGLPAGIYTTNSPAACFHVINDCEANIVVVENEVQLEKILQIRNSLPQLKAIIQFSGNPTHPGILSWQDLLAIGRSLPHNVLEKRIKGLAINQCAVIIYTSGTTGNPKGVMISHDNVLSFAHCTTTYFLRQSNKQERLISYLPLSHLAALGIDLYIALNLRATVYFATPDALKGKMVDTLQEVQPTVFAAVPRIIEKMYERMQDAEASMKSLQRKLFKWAQNQGIKYHLKKNSSNYFSYNIARKLVFSKIKQRLGLQNITGMITGGAPVSKEIKEYFLGLGLVLLEVYGLSESTGIHIGNSEDDYKLDKVGNVNFIKNQKVKITEQDAFGHGEILLHGRNVCMGYYKLEKETLQAIDDDQWLHTGDMGMVDKNGYLAITGRLKELVITSGGENVPPILIENSIKRLLPVVSNCVLIGDRRKYLTMLITLKTELDVDTLLPSDKLSPQALAWCESIGSQAKTVFQILKNNDYNVMNAIQDGIITYNETEAVSNAQKIQKWTILPEDFSLPTGEFGPTGKIRRPVVVKKFAHVIEKMYG